MNLVVCRLFVGQQQCLIVMTVETFELNYFSKEMFKNFNYALRNNDENARKMLFSGRYVQHVKDKIILNLQKYGKYLILVYECIFQQLRLK